MIWVSEAMSKAAIRRVPNRKFSAPDRPLSIANRSGIESTKQKVRELCNRGFLTICCTSMASAPTSSLQAWAASADRILNNTLKSFIARNHRFVRFHCKGLDEHARCSILRLVQGTSNVFILIGRASEAEDVHIVQDADISTLANNHVIAVVLYSYSGASSSLINSSKLCN